MKRLKMLWIVAVAVALAVLFAPVIEPTSYADVGTGETVYKKTIKTPVYYKLETAADGVSIYRVRPMRDFGLSWRLCTRARLDKIAWASRIYQISENPNIPVLLSSEECRGEADERACMLGRGYAIGMEIITQLCLDMSDISESAFLKNPPMFYRKNDRPSCNRSVGDVELVEGGPGWAFTRSYGICLDQGDVFHTTPSDAPPLPEKLVYKVAAVQKSLCRVWVSAGEFDCMPSDGSLVDYESLSGDVVCRPDDTTLMPRLAFVDNQGAMHLGGVSSCPTCSESIVQYIRTCIRADR